MKYIIVLIFSALSLQMCNKKMPVTLISATSQSWAAGTQRGGTGVDYAITLSSTANETINFIALYTNGKVMNVLGKENKPEVGNYFVISTEKSISPSPKADLPIASDAEAILEFKHKNQTYYLEIEKFEKLTHNPMP